MHQLHPIKYHFSIALIDLVSISKVYCPKDHLVNKVSMKGFAIVNSNCLQSTVLYLEASVLVEALPNSVNPKLPISVKTL